VTRGGQSVPEPAVGTSSNTVRQSNLTGLLATILGVALFAWFVRRMGAAQVWEGLRSVGWGLVAIIVITGVRFALRAVAWLLCVEPPHRLPFAAAFPAVLAGDALGNLTPLGLVASEPAKAAFVRRDVALAPAVTALAIENILYTLSVAAMIAASTVALLLTFTLPLSVAEPAWIAVAAIACMFAVAAWLLWRQPAIVRRALTRLLPAGSRFAGRVDQLHDLEEQVYTFARRRRDVLLPVIAAEAGFHALGVVEVYLTWWLLQGQPPTILMAFILEGATRLITVVFKFVPMQAGVAEWTTASFTQMLGYGSQIGGLLSIVRKVRILFWVLVGTSLFVRRGFKL
jgi:hypothetical protein